MPNQLVCKIIKSDTLTKSNYCYFDNHKDAYQKAINAAAEQLSLIIDNENIEIICTPPEIIISAIDGNIPFTNREYINKIKQVFYNEKGNLYPEFSKIEI